MASHTGSLFLEVGQCGNQVGSEFRKLLGKNIANEIPVLHVDSEPKVVEKKKPKPKSKVQKTENTENVSTTHPNDNPQPVEKSPSPRRNHPNPVVHSLAAPLFEQSGRGSNWALGYSGGIAPGSSIFKANKENNDKNLRNAAFQSNDIANIRAQPGATDAELVNAENGDVVAKTNSKITCFSENMFEDENGDERDLINNPMFANLQGGGGSSSSTARIANNLMGNDDDPLLDLNTEPKLVYRVRKKLEEALSRPGANGNLNKIVLSHSVGGGTGSGLGSRLLETLTDSFPELPLITVSVLPFLNCADNSLQAYNASFSLAWMTDFATGSLLFENDAALNQIESEQKARNSSIDRNARNSTTDSANTKTAAFKLLNTSIATAVCGVDFDDFLAYAVPDSKYKFAQSFSYKFPRNSLVHALKPSETDHRKIFLKTLRPPNVPVLDRKAHFGNNSNLYYNRHADTKPSIHSAVSTIYDVNLDFAKPEWIFEAGFNPACFHSESSFFEKRRGWFAADQNTKNGMNALNIPDGNVILNWTRTGDLMSIILDHAERKFANRAFVHWYYSFGVEEAEFESAFETLRTVIGDYDMLHGT